MNLNKLEDLKSIVELPGLYLSNYFSDLRTDVDKEIVSKQSESKQKWTDSNKEDIEG